MKNIRILHIIETGGPGGAETVYMNLSKKLSESGFDVYNILLKDTWLANKLRSFHQTVYIIPSSMAFDFRFIFKISKFIKNKKIDLIHSHLLDTNFYASIVGRLTKVPHIATEHGDIHHYEKSGSKINKLKNYVKFKILLNNPSHIVCVSKYTYNFFNKFGHVNKRKISVIYNGIDIQKFTVNFEKKKKLIQDLNINKTNAIIIGNIGNLYPVKGQIYLIRAMKLLNEWGLNFHLLIIGRGKLLSKLQQEVERLELKEKIHFLGFREDIPELLSIMDIFVLSSLSEGMPVSILEAMASKVSIVTTDVGGIHEFITHQRNGLLVKPGNPAMLANSLKQLILNPQFRNYLSQNAYKDFLNKFESSVMIQNYIKTYEKILNNNTNPLC